MNSDVLIIGGGVAGSVLASRLSKKSSRQVVLVEAGPDFPPGTVPDDIQDVFPRSYANPFYFWPDLKASFREAGPAEPYMQARLVGGGSQVTGMWGVRGVPADYDGWCDQGATGWGFAEVLPYFRRVEHDRDFNSIDHGQNGPVCLSRVPIESWPGFDKAVAAAAAAAGLPKLTDLNGGSADALYPLPLTIDAGSRVSAASAYLTADVRRRRNLRILANTKVDRLVVEERRVTGALASSFNGLSVELKAASVIVSAGAIHSPAILLRSGIGPAAELAALGLPIVVDAPHVGRNLQNHVVTYLGAVIRRGYRQSSTVRCYSMAAARLSSNLRDAPPGDLFVSLIARTSSHAHGNRLGLLGPALYAPYSRGAVRLDPTQPTGSPKVAFNLLSDPRDRIRLIFAARWARALLEHPAVRAATRDPSILPSRPPIRLLNRSGIGSWALTGALAILLDAGGIIRRQALRRVLAPGRLLADIKGEDEFAELVLAGATPMFHPTGTCSIGSVVDFEGRFLGLGGLRVVDASIMPTIPRANTNLPTLMIAEKCADLFEARGT